MGSIAWTQSLPQRTGLISNLDTHSTVLLGNGEMRYEPVIFLRGHHTFDFDFSYTLYSYDV